LDGRVKPGHAAGGQWDNLFEPWCFGIFVQAVWAALVSPAGFQRLGRKRWHKPADKWMTSRRYLRASSLQFSTTVQLSAAFVLLKTIPSDTRI
jgi:hypothetical protein